MNDKVTVVDNAIDESIIYRFLNLIDNDKFITIDKSAYAHAQTDFQIKFYKDDFHTNPAYLEIRSAILEKVSEVADCNIPLPKVYRNFMLKYNDPGMRSALHVEHNDIHGRLGFLFYLNT